ncbi:hypothetical protein C2G38_2111467 [Gigaspora rosea]|uniref:Uncharacterized protein n=1 Tax=Gigaspora rosea TaxID=44941 RepID=A0A397UDE1_9GLOM|nr:hypothetical protein C2G38_2111467 [Gigaspora rosea]
MVLYLKFLFVFFSKCKKVVRYFFEGFACSRFYAYLFRDAAIIDNYHQFDVK